MKGLSQAFGGSGLAERACFALSRMVYERRSRALVRYYDQNSDYQAQDASRVDDARRYLRYFGRTTNFRDKVVVDYACGSGAIAKAIRDLTQPKRLIGVDANAESITRGRAQFPDVDLRVIAGNDTALPADSADVVYCTDAFEHFADPRAVLAEMHRITRPGGYVLVHFIPWLGIEGAHLEGVIPIPWCHVFFSEATLFRTARRVVRAPFYRPLAWDFDADGKRRYDVYDHQEGFDPAYLNRITIRRFRRFCSEFSSDGRLQVTDFEVAGFGGSTYPLARWLAWLAHVPVVNEFANRGVYCAMRKVTR